MTQPLLDEEDLGNINAALEQLTEIEANINKADLAGMDMSRQRQRLENDRARLRQIKAAFFSGR